MSNPNTKTEPISILKHPNQLSPSQPGMSTTGRSARIVLSDEEDEIRYASDNDIDDDEPIAEPMSAEALELLQTEKVLKSGYLLKKGEKRRTWKKRWFVLRTTKLAMYKDKKEYKLLRIIDLHEIHKVVQVTSKHKYKYVFAFVTAKRMYYVQANDQKDMDDWFQLIHHAKEEQRLYDADDDTSSIDRDQEFAKDVITSYKSASALSQRRTSTSPPKNKTKPMDIPIPKRSTVQFNDYAVGHTYPLSPSSEHNHQLSMIDGIASSEDDEEYGVDRANIQSEENRNKVLIEGYLLKLGRNKGWRKRWFVLRTDTLAYYEDEKEYSPHRIIPLNHIMDSLEIDPVSKSKQHCFKIIIPKRSYVLCAPTENDLDSWLNALIVAIRRAKKEQEQVSSTPNTPQPHSYQPQRQLSLIPENDRIQKVQSTSSAEDSFENMSHLSGVSGAGGLGGAGGTLGGSSSSSHTAGLLHLHSRASERLGRAK